MRVNSVMGLLLAVESGVGLAALPDYLVFQFELVVFVFLAPTQLLKGGHLLLGNYNLHLVSGI